MLAIASDQPTSHSQKAMVQRYMHTGKHKIQSIPKFPHSFLFEIRKREVDRYARE